VQYRLYRGERKAISEQVCNVDITELSLAGFE